MSGIIIGDYQISVLPDGSYWIAHRSGEGMQTSAEKLAALIADFYAREF